jgi:outer membrane protein assembly factor BamB
MFVMSMRPIPRTPTRGLIVAFLIGAGSIQAGDWAQFRGPGGMGVASAKSVPVEWSKDTNLLWTAELPGPGGSSPILYGDRIYLHCYTGFNEPGKPGRMEDLKRHLVCLDRATGREVWSIPTAAKLPEQEAIRDEHGYATNTPAIDTERIYAFYGKSGVFAFDHSGKQLWQADVGDGLNGWGSAASPVLYKELVFINASVESETLIALDRKSGNERWRAEGIRESWNTPVLIETADGKTELVVAIMGHILGFDPDSGEKLWSCETDIAWYMVPGLVAKDGVIYCIGGRSGGALAVRAGGRGDVTASHRVWLGKKGSNVSSPVIHGDHLYWAHEQLGIAHCAELSTGEIVGEKRLPRGGQFYSSAIFADGRIYLTSREGTTFVLGATPELEILATNDLRDRSLFHASPAVEDGRIYIRSDKALYCVGAK